MVHEVMQQKVKGMLEAFNVHYPELFIKDLEEDVVLISPNGETTLNLSVKWSIFRVPTISRTVRET